MDLDKFEDFCGGEDFLQKPMKFDLRNSGAAAEQGPEPAGMWVQKEEKQIKKEKR